MLIEIVKEAIRKDELIDFLQGNNEYKYTLAKWINVSAPTDWTKIIPDGIYKLYESENTMGIEILYQEAIVKMLKGDVFDIYVAISIIYFQLISEEGNAAPFIIDRECILDRARKSLAENQLKLEAYFEWQGANHSRGMWGNIERINSLCIKKFNISLIK